jgi:multidrug efflux pump subunit AcrA (membrane-fusion protein)
VQNLYNSAAEVVKLVDLKNVDAFFTDPKSQPPPQAKPDPKLMQIQAQAALDRQQQQTTAALEQAKTQHAAQLAQQRFELDRQMALLTHELAARAQQFEHLHQAATAAAGGPEGVGQGAALAPLLAQLAQMLQQVNAPKRVVRDAQGRVAGVEPVPPLGGFGAADPGATNTVIPAGGTNGVIQ